MDVREFMKTLRTGTLSVDEIGRGMHKSFINARGLIEDAETLLEQRPGRSISLAILAIEEIGKVVLLANAVPRAAKIPVVWKVIQDELDLRSHHHKQTVFAAYGRSLFNHIASKVGKPGFYQENMPEDITPLLDLFKQLGFYVDSVNGQFTCPDEFGRDNREWAEWLIGVAKERIESFDLLHGTEEKSLAVAHRAAEFAALVADAKDEADLKKRIGEFLFRQREKS